MPKLKITLPKGVENLPEEVRRELLLSIQKALNVSLSVPKVSEHNIWTPNTDRMLADAEDDFYQMLVAPAAESFAALFSALGLSVEESEMKKSFSDEFLQKSKFSSILSALAGAFKRSKAFLSVAAQKGKAWTKEQLKKLDEILSFEHPADMIEAFMVRAGLIAKARYEMENQGFHLDGAYHFKDLPKTIQEAQEKPVPFTAEVKNGSGETKTITIEIKPFTADEATVLQHAEAHCASKVKEVTDRQREQIKQIVIRAMKEGKSPRELAQELMDTFGDYNRDWRRVAITELSMAQNDAYLMSCSEGDLVYVAPVPDTCKHCKRLIDGKTFKVSSEPKWDQADEYVWPGKTNFGRKAADYVPCAPLHPYCRHRYHRVTPFHKFVNGEMVLKKPEEVMEEIRQKLAKKGGQNP